jgi:selenocysteine lyase/cysteine desulfurase
MDHLGASGTLRVSMSFYNTKDDIDRLIKGLKEAANFLPKIQKKRLAENGGT